MSNRQLEEQQELAQIAWVASELGIPVDDLMRLDWGLDAVGGNDGAVYGYTVTFADDSDPELLAGIQGLQDDRWVRIGFPPDEPEPEAPE